MEKKPKSNRGRKKGSTSFTELTLAELSLLFKAGDKIKVSRVQLDSLNTEPKKEVPPVDGLEKLDDTF